MPFHSNKKRVKKKQLSLDCFVKPMTNGNSSRSSGSHMRPYKKQVTLESLKGVVVMEDLNQMKQILLTEKNPDKLVTALTQLSEKMPSIEILKTTKIGRIVKGLRNHTSEDVSEGAKHLYTLWKCYIVDIASRQKVDVRCDLETEQVRSRSRRHFVLSLRKGQECVETEETVVLDAARLLEREVFFAAGHLVHRPLYGRLVRLLADRLPKDSTTRQHILGGQKSELQQLVKEMVNSSVMLKSVGTEKSDLDDLQDSLILLEKFVGNKVTDNQRVQVLLEVERQKNIDLKRNVLSSRQDIEKLQDTINFLRKSFNTKIDCQDENIKLKERIRHSNEETEEMKRIHSKQISDLQITLQDSDKSWAAKLDDLRVEFEVKTYESSRVSKALLDEAHTETTQLQIQLKHAQSEFCQERLRLQDEFDQKFHNAQNQQRVKELFSSNPANNIYRQKLEFIESEAKKKIAELEQKLSGLEGNQRKICYNCSGEAGSSVNRRRQTTSMPASFSLASSAQVLKRLSNNQANISTVQNNSTEPSNFKNWPPTTAPSRIQNTTSVPPDIPSKQNTGKRQLFTLSSVSKINENYID